MQVHYDGEIVTSIPTELNPGNGVPFVVIHFGKTRVFAETPDDARAVIRAGVEALRLLDGGVVLGGLRELAAECYAVNSDVTASDDGDAMDDRLDGPDDIPEPCCGAVSRGSFGCTANPGHDGDHVATGTGARGLVPQPAPDREGGCLT